MKSSAGRNISGLALALILTDVTLVAAAGYGSYLARFAQVQVPDFYHLAITSGVLLAALSLVFNDFYTAVYTSSLRSQFADLLMRLFVAFGLLVLLLVFFKISERYSRAWLGLWIISSFLLLLTSRVLLQRILAHYRANGRLSRRVLLLVGEKANGELQQLANIEGFKICQCINFRDPACDLDQLPTLVGSDKIDEVWISTPLHASSGIDKISYVLRHSLVEIRFIPRIDDARLLKHRVSRIGDVYSIDLSYSPLDGVNSGIKRAEDLVLATIIGILILPICFAIALVIKCTSKGPVLFKQYRQGMNGDPIKVYKFRSMEVHDDVAGEIKQACRGDKRIHPFGRFLRRTSLDELPQFYNVIQGRMSIVGPRPHALAHNEYYKDLVESYMWRHKVRPGITGWAQVNGYRGETDTLEKMQNRVAHDLWYIDNWSLALDLRIIVWTIFKGFVHPNAY